MKEEMVSVKFLETFTMNVEVDGKLERRTFRKDDIAELPLELAKQLFREKKVLPGIQHSTTGRVEKIGEIEVS